MSIYSDAIGSNSCVSSSCETLSKPINNSPISTLLSLSNESLLRILDFLRATPFFSNINFADSKPIPLLLTEDNKAKLKDLLNSGVSGVVEIEWDLSNKDQVVSRNQFLQKNNLNIDHGDIYCKWSIRHSSKILIVKQCICGSYHEKEIASGSRVTTACYPYVGCLAFVTISLRNNEICDIAGYLEHFEQCVISRPQRDPPYRLLLYIRSSVENLLSLNVKTLDILAQNARIVKNVFGNHTLIGNSRVLLTAMDITNIKKQILQKS
ncbi:34429_t:CDS:2 [Racocetra persica]|uniref:34429_t:CDS:1 n=1 Tax=Racocetra persica TaxID=160502 RepID=A0ACA9LW43_9GLOM|nr:34429_t:CDS:2 [Racocetra persica]